MGLYLENADSSFILIKKSLCESIQLGSRLTEGDPTQNKEKFFDQESSVCFLESWVLFY